MKPVVKSVYVIAITSYCFAFAFAINLGAVRLLPTEKTQEEALSKLKSMEKTMQNTMDSIMKQAIPMFYRASSDVELSGPCMADILRLVLNLRQFKLWSIQMLDASGIPGGGSMAGSAGSLGSYKQCLDVQFPLLYGEKEGTVGQYCVVEINLPLPPKPKDSTLRLFKPVFTIANATFETEVFQIVKEFMSAMYYFGYRIGICVPSTCTVEDLTNVMTVAAENVYVNAKIYSCEKKETVQMDLLQLIIAAGLVLLVSINIVATVVDHIMVRNSKEKDKDSIKSKSPFAAVIEKIIRAWSINRNFASTISTEPTSAGFTTALSAVHGLRVISLSWVILGHTIFSADPYMLREVLYFKDILRSLPFQAALNGSFSVQTFFFISSLLMSYQCTMFFDVMGMKVFKLPLIIIKRLWRLLPSMILTMALVVMSPLIGGTGPFWKDTTNMSANACRKSWWSIVTFSTTFFEPRDQLCLPHIWFVSVDMQLFLVALVYIYILYKKPAIAKMYLLVLGVSAVLSAAILIYVKDFPPFLDPNLIDVDFVIYYISYYHNSNYVHFGVYAVGLSLGTYLARIKEPAKLPQYAWFLGWAISAAVALTLVYCTQPWTIVKPTMLESVLYGSTSKTAWAMCMAWVTFACSMGKGGLVNDFLSWRGFIPFVQINFAQYLLHVPIILCFAAAFQGPVDLSPMFLIWFFFGHYVISAIAALIFKVIFECPVNHMFYIAFDGYLQKEKKIFEEKKVPLPTFLPQELTNKLYGNDEAAVVNEKYTSKL